jgi:signal transduction histidine kinase
MRSANKNNRATFNAVLLAAFGVLFPVCIAQSAANIYGLLFLAGCVLFFHYIVEMLSGAYAWRIILLVFLFLTYLIFCFFCADWVAILLLPFLLCYHQIINYKRKAGWLIIAGISVLLYYFFMIREIYEPGFNAQISQSVIVMIISIGCILFFALMEKYKEMMHKIEELQGAVAENDFLEKNFSKKLASQQDIAIQNARFEEREALSINIHNAIGHTITSAILDLEAAEDLYTISPEKSMKKVLQAKGKISHGSDSIRRAIRMLDPENETAAISDLISSLRLCAEQFVSSTTLNLRHNLNETSFEMNVPKRHIEFLCGALMELLSNTSRYARATNITILLSCDNKNIKLIVSDNGTVFTLLSDHEKQIKLSAGYGLKKIEKHIRSLGGEFAIRSEGDFTVEITIPIAEDGDRDG